MSKPLKNPDNVDLSDVHYRITTQPISGEHVVVVVQDFDYYDYEQGFSSRRVYPYTDKGFEKACKKADKLNRESDG